MTLCAVSDPAADAHEVATGLAARVVMVREASLPLVDPHPAACADASASPPGRYGPRWQWPSSASAPGLDKVVLAREVTVEAPRAHDSAALYGALRAVPDCFCFLLRVAGGVLGASPEPRAAQRLHAWTRSGSPATRRSADPQ
jgi:hypothetical protein